jgi:hypothetical protein
MESLERASIKVAIDLSGESDLDLFLVFSEPISDRDFTINTHPTAEENKRLEDFCRPVVRAIITCWIESPGVNGINWLTITRHLVHVRRAHNKFFPWDPIVQPLIDAIRESSRDCSVEFVTWNKEKKEFDPYVEPTTELYHISRAIFESSCEDSEAAPIPSQERV